MKILNDDAVDGGRALRRPPLLCSGFYKAPRSFSKLTVLVTRRLSKVACCMLFSTCMMLLNSPSVLAASDSRCARIDERVRYGPFDYRQGRTTLRQNLSIVEEYHFRPEMQREAMRGEGSWFQMDYTLRAFPNHAPALFLIGIMEQKITNYKTEYLKKLQRRNDYSPAGCYFERAIRFAPDDPNVYNAYGRFLALSKFYDKAIEAFKTAVKLAPKVASAHYNLGLAYYAAGKFDESAKAARKAYSLGYKKPQLRTRLKRNGHW